MSWKRIAGFYQLRVRCSSTLKSFAISIEISDRSGTQSNCAAMRAKILLIFPKQYSKKCLEKKANHNRPDFSFSASCLPCPLPSPPYPYRLHDRSNPTRGKYRFQIIIAHTAKKQLIDELKPFHLFEGYTLQLNGSQSTLGIRHNERPYRCGRLVK